VPGRTGSNIEARTTIELARVNGIVAVKEASGNIGQIVDIIRDRPRAFGALGRRCSRCRSWRWVKVIR
jgi:4-hydroxy-tetrahydrodipicolinate synthase